MRSVILTLCLTCLPVAAQANFRPDDVVSEARERTLLDVTYDPKYMRLDYPGGDVPDNTSVCTDVIIRSFRNAYGFDSQKAVH